MWKNSTQQGEVDGLMIFNIQVASEERVLPPLKPGGVALGITSPVPIASVGRGHLQLNQSDQNLAAYGHG